MVVPARSACLQKGNKAAPTGAIKAGPAQKWIPCDYTRAGRPTTVMPRGSVGGSGLNISRVNISLGM
jgi:hypothetical protein